MAESRMKSESPAEARARLQALSEAEKTGAEAAAEGQIQPAQPTGGDAPAADAIRLDDPRTSEAARLGSSAEVEQAKAEAAGLSADSDPAAGGQPVDAAVTTTSGGSGAKSGTARSSSKR